MKIREEIEHQLNKPSHIVKVEDVDTGQRLEKDAKNMRFAFSLDDINAEFGSIKKFIDDLKDKGFGNTRFLFQRTYGTPEKATYHTMKEVTKDLKKSVKSEKSRGKSEEITQEDATKRKVTQSVPTQPQITSFDFLSGANPMQYLGALVDSQRVGDYQKRMLELEEELKDAKSKVRRLEEQNNSLKLKVETVEERADLRVQRELLDKEGVLEKAGTQKILESVGGLIPHFASFLENKKATGLNAPAVNLPPLHQQAFDLLKQSDDEKASVVVYILSNYNDELRQMIGNYINKQ